MTQIDELVKRARSVDEEKLNVEPWTCEQLIKGLADVLEAQAAENARLKERLGPRGLVVVEFNGVGHYVSEAVAARIAALEAQLEAFRKALEPLARMDAQTNQPDDSEAYAFDNWAADRAVFTIGKDRIITVGDIRRARALMSALAASQRRDGPEVLALRNAEGEKDGVE